MSWRLMDSVNVKTDTITHGNRHQYFKWIRDIFDIHFTYHSTTLKLKISYSELVHGGDEGNVKVISNFDGAAIHLGDALCDYN